MELNVGKFSLSTLITAVILYAVCVIFVVIAPDLAIKIAGRLIHTVNVSQFVSEVSVTLGEILLGSIPLLIYSYFGALIFASIYNKFVKTNK